MNDKIKRNILFTKKNALIKKNKDFLEEAEKEKEELNESYKESVRQTKERKK
jgi:hypothetical protein